NLGAGADSGVQLFARLGIQPFRVVEAARHALGVENDGGGHDRAGERAPARLVAAGDRPDTALQRRPLASEGRSNGLLAERQGEDSAPSGVCAAHGAMVRTMACKSTYAPRACE